MITIKETSRHYIVAFPFDHEMVTAIKSIPGSWYDREKKQWKVLKYRSREMENFKVRFNYQDPTAEGYQEPERFDVIPPLPEITPWDIPLLIKPYPYQYNGIAYILQHPRTFVADQPGLGKTMQSIAAVLAMNAFPCIVICPATLKENWRREWMKVSGKRAMILRDSVKTTWPSYYQVGMCDVFIVNYESLGKYFVLDYTNGDEPLKLKHVRFRSTIKLFKSAIVDESHKCRNTDTIAAKLTRGVCADKEVVLALTGTPMVNKPKDLIAQLGIIGQLKVFGGEDNFKLRYCEVGKKKKAANLKELNYYLHLNCYYRREKHEVLKDLPPKVRQIMYCNITNRREYEIAKNRFVEYLREIRKKSPEEIARALRGQFMVQMGMLKQVSARGKLADVKEYVDEIIEGGEKVVLFCFLQDMIKAVKALYPHALTIYGEDSLDDRQRSVDLFQTDPARNIIVCNYKSAGVGLTLTASSRVGFIEFPWTFADCEQCEDRTHRIGQKNIDVLESIQCTYFLGEDTIDDYCYEIIEKKKDLHDMINGTTEKVQVDIIDQILNLFTKKKEPVTEETF